MNKLKRFGKFQAVLVEMRILGAYLILARNFPHTTESEQSERLTPLPKEKLNLRETKGSLDLETCKIFHPSPN